MTVAAKHFDPQLGIDIHLYVIPPSPVPVPLPTPHIGIVFDPFDYLPFIGGTVHVHGVKRATAGTGGLGIHIPVGGLWAPPAQAPQGPQVDDQLFMGSQTVIADGAPFSKLCMPVLDCNMVGMIPPLRLKKPKKPTLSLTLPTAVNLAIPSNVTVGGPPTIDMAGLLFQAALAGALKGLKALKKLKRFESAMENFRQWRRNKFKEMPSGLLKCKVLRAEPVDIRDGSVAVAHHDFTIPGRLPLAWPRHYRSRTQQHGLCGRGWQTPADLHLELDADGIVVFADLERDVVFASLPAADGIEHAVTELVDGARLYAEGGEYHVRSKEGLDLVFQRPGHALATPTPARLPIERIEDRCGNHWRFERTDGRLTRIQESGIDGLQGRFIHVAMQGACLHQLLLHDPATGINHPLVEYAHDEVGDLVAVTDPLGASRTFEYAQHLLVRHTDRTGLSFYYEYNARQQVIHAWGDGGLHDYRFHYDALLQETGITDSLGHASLVKFDENGLPLCEIDPLDGVTVFEYDSCGRTTAVVDPMGLRTGFDYDRRGNLLTLTRADGSTVQTAYDDDDQPIAITDAAGATWRQQWDERGLLLEQRTPLGATTQYSYDARGQLIEHRNALGATTALRFDRHGSLQQLVDAMGQLSRFEHDALGRLLSKTDVAGRTSRYRHDAKGRLLEAIAPGDGRVHCAYDAEDQLVRYRDEAGHVTQLEYTGISQLARRRLPDGHTIAYEYDTEEQLIAVINQRGERYELKRDALGRIIEEVDYWGQARQYAYDAAGRLGRSTDPLDRSVSFDTDPLGRVTRKSLPDLQDPSRAIHETFRYDPCGRLVELRNAVAHVTRQFDAEGRLQQEIQNGFAVENSYDALGHRTERRSSAGNTVRIAHDLLGRPQAIAINDAAPITIERNALGQVVAEQLSASLRRTLGYNLDGQLTDLAVTNDHAPVFDTHYAYDDTGNLIQRIDSANGTDHYSYDPIGRVLEHTDPTGKLSRWLNDPAGDRLRTRVLEMRMKQTVGGAPLVDSWTREGDCNGRHYVFDRAGNLVRREHFEETGRPVLHLAWDANQRLAESHWEGGDRDAARTTYGYDPSGRRVFKRNPTHTTWFFWDGDALLGEVEQPNDTTRSHLREPVTGDNNVVDFLAARRRIDALKALHPQAREYVCKPGTFEPLAFVERAKPQAAPVAAPATDAAPGASAPPTHAPSHRDLSHHAPAKTRPQPVAAPMQGGLGRGLGLGLASSEATAPAAGRSTVDPDHGVGAANAPPLPPAAAPALGRGMSLGVIGARPAGPSRSADVPLGMGNGQRAMDEPPMPPPTDRAHPPGTPATGVPPPTETLMAPSLVYYHNDPNGCPIRLTDAHGQLLWSASFSAWASVRQYHVSLVANPIRLQGQYEDDETGLYYNRHRCYEPHAGQFVSQDPVRLVGGINPYRYAPNSLVWTDPSGLMPWQPGEPKPKGWRLPKNGTWEGEAGHSNFIPTDPESLGLKAGDKIPFVGGMPDFSQYATETLDVPGMTGVHDTDMPMIHRAYAEANDLPNQTAGRTALSSAGSTPHHAGGAVVHIVPTQLHANVRHNGGAAELRSNC